MNAQGIEQVIARLRNLAVKVPDNARKTMHRGADKIVEDGKLYTPVDLHNLEESIRKVVDYERRGRLKIDIEVGGIVNGVNVDAYAVRIHENYDDNNPGLGTRKKRAANPGVIIGRKFLERALEGQREKLRRAMIEAIEEDLRV